MACEPDQFSLPHHQAEKNSLYTLQYKLQVEEFYPGRDHHLTPNSLFLPTDAANLSEPGIF